MDELLPGLWAWSATHPEWTPAQGGPDGWEADVWSYACDDGETLVLFDPLEPPPPILALAGERRLAVLLANLDHERSAPALVGELGATAYVPEAIRASFAFPTTPFPVGAALPGGVEAHTAFYAEEATFWLPRCGALVAGDVLIGDGAGGVRTAPDAWLSPGVTHEALREGLAPLAELPVQLVLLTHGGPVVDDARSRLRRALA